MRGGPRRWSVLALALAALACGRGAGPGRPNLVLVTLDTTRADHLGTYGYFRDTSPRFDAFAREALVFDRAYAPMATTLPAHTSLLTGTEPLEHGVLGNVAFGARSFVASPSLRSFASIAADAGWRTAAFVSAAPLQRGSGIEVGFEHFDDPPPPATHRHGDATTDAALAWLAQARGPFFLWVHYYDAHWPWIVPPPWKGSFHTDAALVRWLAERHVAPRSERELVGTEEAIATANAYDAALRFQDAQLGRVLDALAARPDWNDTAVVILGDHGEGLSQHGLSAHGGTWNEQLQVPLAMRIPGAAARRIDTPTSIVDVLPTLLAHIHAPALAHSLQQASGRDVLADGAAARPVFAQDTGRTYDQPGYRWALTTPRWKYFRIDGEGGAKREELYDLGADPYELHDVAAEHGKVVHSLREDLAREIAAQEKRARALRGTSEPQLAPADPAWVEELRQLGYVDGAAPASDAGHSAPRAGGSGTP